MPENLSTPRMRFDLYFKSGMSDFASSNLLTRIEGA